MQTVAPDRPRTPFWKAALHVGIATAVGNAVFLVDIVGGRALPFHLWFGCFAVLMLFEASVLANAMVSAWLARAERCVLLALLAAFFLGILTTWALAHGVDTYVLDPALSARVIFGMVAFIPLPIIGFAFALLCPSARRGRLLAIVALGIGLLVATEALLLALVFGWDWLKMAVPPALHPGASITGIFSALLTVLLPYSLTVSIISRRLAQAAQAKVDGARPVVRRRALVLVMVLIALATAAVLPVTVCRRLQVHRLMEAIDTGDTAKVEPFLTDASVLLWRDDDGTTPLGKAAQKGHMKLVKFLLSKGADANAKSTDDGTALHDAAALGGKKVVELLIAEGADIEARGRYGGTPLIWAAQYGEEDTVQLLLRKGANVKARTVQDGTALHAAAQPFGSDKIVGPLVAAGADVNARTIDGWTPMHMAVRNGQLGVVRELIAHGADVNARTNRGDTPLDLARQGGEAIHDAIAGDLERHGGKPGKDVKK